LKNKAEVISGDGKNKDNKSAIVYTRLTFEAINMAVLMLKFGLFKTKIPREGDKGAGFMNQINVFKKMKGKDGFCKKKKKIEATNPSTGRRS